MTSLKLEFTIGHSASRKTKPSREGFTHDWELFVQGASESNVISHYVDKVVFNLHESFPKPKRGESLKLKRSSLKLQLTNNNI